MGRGERASREPGGVAHHAAWTPPALQLARANGRRRHRHGWRPRHDERTHHQPQAAGSACVQAWVLGGAVSATCALSDSNVSHPGGWFALRWRRVPVSHTPPHEEKGLPDPSRALRVSVSISPAHSVVEAGGAAAAIAAYVANGSLPEELAAFSSRLADLELIREHNQRCGGKFLTGDAFDLGATVLMAIVKMRIRIDSLGSGGLNSACGLTGGLTRMHTWRPQCC
eukprot:6956475-Prymnesium_polylepis.1